jgi:hypothetical protein
MALFTPIAQQDVAVERPVERTSGIGAIATALTSTAKNFFDYKAASAPTPAERKDLIVQNLGLELEKAASLKDQGKDNFGMAATKALRTAVASGAEIPDSMKTMYEGITGNPYESFSYENTDKYYQEQQLNSEAAQVLRTGVISMAKSQGKTLTEEEIDAGVLQTLGEKAVLQAELDSQAQRLALGMSIDPTSISTNIQSDFQTLFAYANKAREDGLVTNEELTSAQSSVRNLIAQKYGKYSTNVEVKAVLDQMNGLVEDLSAGVSTDPLEIQLDVIQLALSKGGFDAGVIATTRSLIKTNPQAFQQILQRELGKEGKGIADALVSVFEGSPTVKSPEDIFKPVRPPTATTPGVNPSLIPLPAVTTNPDDYKTCVEGLGQITSSTDPTKITTDTQARNAWLTQMNLCGSAVASQSNDYILGEKLLATFAGNGVINNLEAVYKTDDINAAQTNDVLQQALSSERTRQTLEISSRTSTALGGQDLILFDSKGVLQLNIPALDAVADNLAGGRQGWEDMKRLIDQVGGLEAFIKKPATAGYDKSVAGSGMAGGRVSLDAMLGVNFNRVGKLVDNVKSIDAKLVGLQNLATKYSSATELYSSTKPQEAVTTDTTSTAPDSGNGYKPPEEVTKDTAFMGKVNSVSTDLGINPTDLLRVIEFETGKSFSPAVKSPNSSATGLIQFMGATAKGLGTTTEALAGMTRAEQMDYVAKYLAPYKGKIKNFGDLYLAVHWPAAIGKDEAYVMYEKGSKEYTANKNLDTNGDGTVTRGETIARVLSGTGGGVMTTPYTAEAEKMIQPEAQLLPPELTGGTTAPSPDMATTPQPVPVEALPATTPALSAQEQAIRQEAEGKTAANTPIDQTVMDTIKMLAANPNDVRVFATQDELIQAYNNQELRLGSLVVINGEVKAVTQDMVGAK